MYKTRQIHLKNKEHDEYGATQSSNETTDAHGIGSAAAGGARPDSDYNCVYEVSKAELADQLAPAKEMIDTIARMVKE